MLKIFSEVFRGATFNDSNKSENSFKNTQEQPSTKTFNDLSKQLSLQLISLKAVEQNKFKPHNAFAHI